MPPITGIPYPPAPAWCFPLAEVSLYLLFAACIVHATRQGGRSVGYLLGGVMFGLILEYVNVRANLGYTYGKFLLMFGTPPKDIPFCIGVGWGVIMYTARLFSDALGLSLWAAAALDALLAINIDLSMDTVAYRLHMWHWDWSEQGLDPLTAQWFGVPYGNFFGWLMVVFFFSSFSRLLERHFLSRRSPGRLKTAVTPLAAVFLSQICLYVMLLHVDPFLKEQFGITSLHRFVAFMIVLAAIAGWGLLRRKREAPLLPVIAWLTPLWLHTFFFAWLFIGGFYKENMGLVLTASANMLVGVCIHVIALPRRRTLQPAVQRA